MTPHPEPRIMTTAEPKNGVVETLLATIESISRRLENHWTDIEAIIKRLDALERVQRDAETGDEPAQWEPAVYRQWWYDAVRKRDASIALLNVERDRANALHAERDAAREALRIYGRHTEECVEGNIGHVFAICTCGLAAALASATPAEGGEG